MVFCRFVPICSVLGGPRIEKVQKDQYTLLYSLAAPKVHNVDLEEATGKSIVNSAPTGHAPIYSRHKYVWLKSGM